MVDAELVQREHVLQAIDDDAAPPPTAGDYVLRYAGREYDATWVAAAASVFAGAHTSHAEAAAELDQREAADRLQVLAFDVSGAGLARLRYATATAVGQEHARATWTLAARERLLEAAERYHAIVGMDELANFVQRRSLIRTNQRPQSWLGDILRRVADGCAEQREPLLSALTVDSKGRVWGGYADAVEELRGERLSDPQEHAARERLECHRRFGATLPADGGVPARVDQPQPQPQPRRTEAGSGSAGAPAKPRAAATPARPAPARAAASTRTSTRVPSKRRSAAETVAAEKPTAICPVHFTVLPASGVCDLCD